MRLDSNIHNRIAEKLKDAFFRLNRHKASPAEVESGRNSLKSVSMVLEDAKFHDHGILAPPA